MYMLNPPPAQIDSQLLDLLRKAEPATIGHFLHTGFMDPGVRGLFPDIRIAGTAVTVRAPGPDATIVHYAIGQARPGDILVIDRCGDMKHACMGGAVAYAARKAGVAGIVVDGMVRVINAARARQMPASIGITFPDAEMAKWYGAGANFIFCGDDVSLLAVQASKVLANMRQMAAGK